MTVRLLDSAGDITTSGTQFVGEVAEISQTIKTRLALYFGEYFRDINEGTRWFEDVLGKQPTLTSRAAELRRRIITTVGVEEITKFDADFDLSNRRLSVVAEVRTTGGELLPIEFGSQS